MSDIKHIIEPERQGLWIAVTFIIALLSFVIALVGISRINNTVVATQLEVLILNKKIESLQANKNTPAPMPMAPMAPAEPAAQ
ncbi:hypothetical protein CAP31_03570 [Sulfuriferula sp. AH1]|uniref:hypothetical protein n=1 Tax=Sulfuriferula sp. AH1 TaxID=1985873 RepID=UPI000B3B670A|nr:hypothetical protein [Sulfuriferula sp. AH1]ARU30844.1 hypothetical protein CAP31_03570 [Sulfuriferula sp. AH1]